AAQGQAFFVPAMESCVVSAGGGQGTTGQLFTQSGISFSESLIKAGLAGSVDGGGSCGEDLVNGCYQALKESSVPPSAGDISKFLWKPRAESDYNKGSLVIHVDACDATVFVNGDALLDFGPANGRCNTSRAFKPGCAFGANVRV